MNGRRIVLTPVRGSGDGRTVNDSGCRVACRLWPLLQGWSMGGGLPGVCAAGADPAEDPRGECLPVLVGALPGFGDGVGAVAAGAAGLRLSFLL